MRRFRLLILLALVVIAAFAAVRCFEWLAAELGGASRHAVAGHGGAVASAERSATNVGLAVLREGGDAADAAVAVALALAVVHPQAGNLGGGGFAVVRFSGDAYALDFRETAPARATADMFMGPDGQPIPERSLVGPLAVGTPGSPAGLFELHRRFGRLPWERVVAPAVGLARDGFAVSERLSRAITDERALLARFPETAAVWLPGGAPPAPGAVMKLPALARALDDYEQRGPAALTEGRGATAIADALGRRGGILSVADLANYKPLWRPPIRFAAFGWHVASMPLPSSGGIILDETLMILERTGWPRLPRNGWERTHLLAEAWRRAFADRFLLGDPSTTEATAAQLLDPAWIARSTAGIDRDRATPSDDVRPWPGDGAREHPQTTHLSVIDAAGDAVSLTTTLNGSFGCGILVPELGILLNNEMDDFTAAPGRPNLYGLVQGRANAVGPGKRMLSSMSPTIAWRGDDIVVLGSPGGSRIPTATAQVLLAVIVDGEALQAAVNRGRLHHQWRPDALVYEPGALDAAQVAALRERGHTLVGGATIGEVNAVRRRADGTFEAAADARGPGNAAAIESPSGRGDHR